MVMDLSSWTKRNRALLKHCHAGFVIGLRMGKAAPSGGCKALRIGIYSLWEANSNSELHQGTACVCGVAVSMAAFQAVDPGSTPGKRIAF